MSAERPDEGAAGAAGGEAVGGAEAGEGVRVSEFQPAPIRARRNNVGLCLSGGGFRATLFHVGALRRLNEVGLLSRVDTVSSVSGGSITNGLLARAWPRLRRDEAGVFVNFAEEVEAPVRAFCATNVRNQALIWARLSPANLKRFWWDGQTATNFLADVYEDRLVRGLTLQHLSDVRAAGGPNFVFCATNFQTGVNFVFDARDVGDWKIGRTPARRLRLAEAIASSSAFPIAFPPLVLDFDPARDKFSRGALAGCPEYDEITRRVLLTDGGVYDNLGLEPVWKNHGVVFCSDGGGPYQLKAAPSSNLLSRLAHSNDIINNQARAVRKRWLVASYENQVYEGTYWGITTDVANYDDPSAVGYRGQVLDLISKVRTDLDPFSEGEQLVLMNHGWALVKAALRSHFPSAPDAPGTPPSPELLASPEAAARAVRDSAKLKIFRRP